MNVYDLVIKRDNLKYDIDILSEKTNSNFGKHISIWDTLTRKQYELKEIEERLKEIEVNDKCEKIREMKHNENQDEFEKAYKKYVKYIEQSSFGLVNTDRQEFLKLYCFYGEIIQPDMLKLIKAVAGISND